MEGFPESNYYENEEFYTVALRSLIEPLENNNAEVTDIAEVSGGYNALINYSYHGEERQICYQIRFNSSQSAPVISTASSSHPEISFNSDISAESVSDEIKSHIAELLSSIEYGEETEKKFHTRIEAGLSKRIKEYEKLSSAEKANFFSTPKINSISKTPKDLDIRHVDFIITIQKDTTILVCGVDVKSSPQIGRKPHMMSHYVLSNLSQLLQEKIPAPLGIIIAPEIIQIVADNPNADVKPDFLAYEAHLLRKLNSYL